LVRAGVSDLRPKLAFNLVVFGLVEHPEHDHVVAGVDDECLDLWDGLAGTDAMHGRRIL
jgi:hypothetical protein